MLSKENRVVRKKDFAEVFKRSKPVYSGNLAIRAAENRLNTPRFGFVISNRVEKRSTRRNSLKRHLRAIARENLGRIESFDIVLLVNRSYAYPFRHEELERDLLEGLKKSKLIKTNN